VSGLTRRFSVSAGALAGLCLLASGCGGSPRSGVAQLGTSTAQSATAHGGSTGTALAFAGCMHSHGVPLWPDPGSSGASGQAPLTLHQLDVSSSQLASAERACRSLLPTPSPSHASPHALAQALTFSRCMRTHGVSDFPDPESDGALVIPHALENSATYLAALHVCERTYGVPPPPGSAGKR
jgi:hypothetical protein